MLISVKTNKLENSENGVKGLATVTFGDAFKVQSISIVEGKNGLFVSMPSYKSKQVDENGDPIYKDICNPITKDFRDQLYGAILSSFQNDREATIGEADGRNMLLSIKKSQKYRRKFPTYNYRRNVPAIIPI